MKRQRSGGQPRPGSHHDSALIADTLDELAPEIPKCTFSVAMGSVN